VYCKIALGFVQFMTVMQLVNSIYASNSIGDAVKYAKTKARVKNCKYIAYVFAWMGILTSITLMVYCIFLQVYVTGLPIDSDEEYDFYVEEQGKLFSIQGASCTYLFCILTVFLIVAYVILQYAFSMQKRCTDQTMNAVDLD
jgi:hypothetical protein